MELLKRTYTLPPEALLQFEHEVPAGKRSSTIATLIREWLNRRKREGLKNEIIAGCQDKRRLLASLCQVGEATMRRIEEALKIATGLVHI